jgi:hypothetical protein
MNEIVGDICGWYYQGKTEVLGNNLSHCHFVHHKCCMDWPEIETGPLRWQTDNKVPETWQGLTSYFGCGDKGKDLHIPDGTPTSGIQSKATFTSYGSSTVKMLKCQHLYN